MIRARVLLRRKPLASQVVRSLSHASARVVGAASTVTSSEWTSHHASSVACAAAAGALILGSSLVNDGRDKEARMSLCNPSSLVQCEAALREDETGSESKIRTISREDITEHQQHNHDVKSLRAYRSAVDNDLFRDEIKSETGATTLSPNAEGNNAITERIVSLPFSSVQHVNVRPRISIRHTHRSHGTDDDLGGVEVEEMEDQLLATSTGEVAAVPAKNFNTTLGTIVKEPDAEGFKLNEVHLRKIKTAYGNNARNCLDQVYTKNMYFYKSAAIMKDNVRAKFRLFALPSSESLGKEMAFLLDTELNCIDVGSYADGETNVQIGDAVRGKNVFVVCATSSATAITELLLTLSALRRGSAKRICAILPYYGYSRQDRRTGMKREPIAAADMAYLLEEMGVDSVICVDLHNALVKGFFSPEIPVDHLSPGPVAAAYFYEELFGVGDEKKEEPPKITVVAAHENQVRRANIFRNALMKLSGNDDVRVALISNTRKLKEDTMSDEAQIIGEVDGRHCIIVDDIITTGSTMLKAIEAVNKAGASEVYAWATHGVRHTENNVPQKLMEIDGLKYLLISNSVAVPKANTEGETRENVTCPKIRKLSIAPLLSEAVSRALNNESLRNVMDMKLEETDK